MADVGPDALKAERDRFIGFAFASADLLLALGADLRITWAAGAVRVLLGVDSERIVGLPFARFVSRIDAVAAETAVRELGIGERKKNLELTLVVEGGGSVPAMASIYRSLKPGAAEYSVSITHRDAAGPQSHPTSPRDRMTGLIEAVEFAESTAQALRQVRAAGQSAQLTLVEICGEAELGRLLGSERSQALLREVGAQLRSHAATEGGAVQLGDGRFSVVQIEDDAAPSIGDVIARIGADYAVDPADLKVQASTLAFNPSLAETDVESILSHVLEQFRTEGAKAIGSGSAATYLRKMAAETLSRVVMMRDLIHERRISLHYQPIVGLGDRKTHHYEVLLRFPDGRSPFQDILFAEQINTIHEVDLAVARGAIARLEEAESKQQELSLAVNMSARSLLNDTFLSMFEELADKVGHARGRLIVEITESAKLDDLDKAAGAVARLNARGHPVCLDDFGAGASSLPYLQRLIVGYVKIDGAYVRGIDGRMRERAIIEGVLATCRSLGVKTVAEMVEHEEEHKILAELGVTLGQGWLYGRPSAQIPGPESSTARVPRKLDPASIGRLLIKNTTR